MNEIQQLQIENRKLIEKLAIAKKWMSAQVQENMRRITSEKVLWDTTFWEDLDHLDERIETKIYEFFGEILLMNIPSSVIENIVSAEINYYHLKANPNFDGLSVISGYHKALDTLIETYIIRDFRKFAKKHNQDELHQNDPLEKALHMVVNKKYILSLGRLFHLIQRLRKNEKLWDYQSSFKQYLEHHSDVSQVILSDSFYLLLTQVVDSEVLWKKRHEWKINFLETREAREKIVGRLRDRDCLIYQLIAIKKIDF